MKRWIVFSLVCLIGSVLFSSLPVKAQSNSVISLEEQNVILPNSDVELISVGENTIYVVVNCQGRYNLFRSEDSGRSWQKVSGEGLPEREKFISLKALTNRPEVVALATTTSVYLFRDNGKHFECLGGPPGLVERGEEITSLAISDGNPPQILVGIWHPNQEKFAQEGVYLWGLGGKYSWEPQGMRQIWQNKGYASDVTSVAFLGATILAVASGDPDDSGPLLEGTYLNIAYSSQRTIFGVDWNWFSDWPIEISQISGQSPTEREILSSKIALSEFEDREGRIYIVYNTRDRSKDDVYQIKLSERYGFEEVRKLEVPETPEILSFDSIDYAGTAISGTLAVGVTMSEGAQRDRRDGVIIYCLSTTNERCCPPYWKRKWLRTVDAQNCQVAISPDGTIFAATSGLASSFSRSEKNILIPISLIDASKGINQLTPSPNFLEDKTLFLNYGNRNILKVILDEDYQLVEAQRLLYVPQRFNPDRIKIEPGFNQNLFVFEAGTKKFWLSKNTGLSWLEMETEVEIVDAKVANEKIWVAGKDGLIYLMVNGVTQKRISSGLTWIQKIEPGPKGILAIGGTKENISETISLVDQNRFEVLPTLPVSSRYVEIAFAPEDKSIYCGVNNQLYRLNEDWQEMTKLARVSQILTSPQGLYVFCKSQIYFSPFPLTKGSQWEALGGEELKGSWLGCKLVQLEEKKNLLFFWNSSKIVVWTHEIPEEKPEEEILPQPVEPEPVEPEPVEPEPVVPEPLTSPAPPVEPPPVSSALPWPIWIVIGLGGIYLLIVFLVISRRR